MLDGNGGILPLGLHLLDTLELVKIEPGSAAERNDRVPVCIGMALAELNWNVVNSVRDVALRKTPASNPVPRNIIHLTGRMQFRSHRIICITTLRSEHNNT